jgi:hypothetical protein
MRMINMWDSNLYKNSNRVGAPYYALDNLYKNSNRVGAPYFGQLDEFTA